jgi:acetyl/propionyl-CoA carboxylase alpha subunit
MEPKGDRMNKVMSPDDRIGIVNRGEAALRLIRAVREYNNLHGTQLKTVALYIDKEEHAPFVKMADDSLALSKVEGYPGKQKSPYLDHELILEALEMADCQAIWVGWGFVSEDADFAEKIEKKGIVFMGPSSKAMAELGDKITAKDIAEKAGVPILPWSRKSVDKPGRGLFHSRRYRISGHRKGVQCRRRTRNSICHDQSRYGGTV